MDLAKNALSLSLYTLGGRWPSPKPFVEPIAHTSWNRSKPSVEDGPVLNPS
jgi:hypothetical protein